MKSLEQKAWEKWAKRNAYRGDSLFSPIFKAGYRAHLKQANPLGKLEARVIKTVLADESVNAGLGHYVGMDLGKAVRSLQAARKKVKK